MLSRVGLGSPERSRYTEQLRHVGPPELENYARWAQHKGDRILAAAVLSRLDALPTKQRPIKATEYANSLLGDEFREIETAFKRIHLATQRAINANREFERGHVDPTAKISMGLAARKLP